MSHSSSTAAVLKATFPIRVRYAETDAAGVVYHGSFFPWFESARVSLLDEVGLPYRELERLGFRLPVLECQAEFKSYCFFDDRLEVEVLAELPISVRLRLQYQVHRPSDGVLVATGYTRHAVVDLRGKPSRPPAALVEAFARKAGAVA